MKESLKAIESLSSQVPEINKHTNLLMDDEPLQVLPKLATILGLEEAIIIQQLWYWLNPKRKAGKVIDGQRWIYNTYKEWRESNFPFWSEIHIKRLFLNLEKAGIIVSCQPEGRMSRRKYYRLNEAFVARAKRGDLRNPDGSIQIRSSYQIDTFDGSSRYVPSTESTYRENKQREKREKTPLKNGDGDFQTFPATWKPNPRTKEQQLESINPGLDYPSAIEFEQFLDSMHNGTKLDDYRPDLYSQLCENKWHQWRDDLRKWVKVRNWKSYVQALADKIEENLDNF